MTLQLPSEIVVERFLPTARAMLATRLDEEGWTQQEIADQLGVTQAAVSKYGSGSVTIEERFRADARMQQTIERIADGLASGEMDEYAVLDELLALVREFEDRGPICAVHEEEMPALQGMGCDLCVRGTDTAVQAERTVLSSVRRATRLLADSDFVADDIPNVGLYSALHCRTPKTRSMWPQSPAGFTTCGGGSTSRRTPSSARRNTSRGRYWLR